MWRIYGGAILVIAVGLAGCGMSSHHGKNSESPAQVTSVQSSVPQVGRPHRPKRSEGKETYETGYIEKTNPQAP